METIKVKEEAINDLTGFLGDDFKEVGSRIKDICIEYAMRVASDEESIREMQENIMVLSMVADFMKSVEINK